MMATKPSTPATIPMISARLVFLGGGLTAVPGVRGLGGVAVDMVPGGGGVPGIAGGGVNGLRGGGNTLGLTA